MKDFQLKKFNFIVFSDFFLIKKILYFHFGRTISLTKTTENQ